MSLNYISRQDEQPADQPTDQPVEGPQPAGPAPEGDVNPPATPPVST